MASLKKRGKTYYAQYYVNGKQVRANLETTSLQIAKEKIRQIESAQLRQDDIPLPTKTPLPDIVDKYVFHLKAHSSERNVQKVVSYLRGTFGQVCEGLKIKNDIIAAKAVKRPASGKFDLIELGCLEQLATVQVSGFLANLVVYKGVSAKTVNHYRQILLTMCNWAMTEGGVKFPGGKNPVEAVKRYREIKSDIRFLKMPQIDEQLQVLAGNLMLQTMVAFYIYAGLRREEALWLMPSDIDLEAGNYGAIRIRDKSFNGKSWVPKTRSNRTVPISRTLRGYLDTYLQKYTLVDWFFPSPDGYRWDPDNFSAHLRSANEDARLQWTCLDFRHSFGSHLAMRGESLYKISKLMGNSPQICEKHYAALLPESLFETVEFSGPNAVEQSQRQRLELIKKEKPDIQRNDGEKRPALRLVVNNR
ncbi:site-specific integrase [Geobacter sp. FeAm09]|uniref:tyrosine-type recombinase/integrase n=1 Tax=Geobacter sp. FeAm09 TaxID=2597769 RepID=UPI0011F04037|nr:site-specific integrase [Geobacter sp. FeAm09]QEM67710.1 site-specific integrase [Geobacter sp. FeAm09]